MSKLLALCFFLALGVYTDTDFISAANEALKNGDSASAMQKYNEAIQNDASKNSIAYLLLGNIYMSKGRCGLAIENYNNYIKHNPSKLLDPSIKKIKCFIKLGKVDSASQILEELEDDTDLNGMEIKEVKDLLMTVKEKNTKFNSLIKTMNCNSALKLFDELVKYISHSVDLYKSRILCLKKENNQKAVLLTYVVISSLSPDDPHLMFSISKDFVGFCDFKEAFNYVRKALSIDRENSQYMGYFKSLKKLINTWSDIETASKVEDHQKVTSLINTIETSALSADYQDGCVKKLDIYRCIMKATLKEDLEKTFKLCQSVINGGFLESSVEYESVLLATAKIHMDYERFTEALELIDKVLKRNPQDRRAHDLKKAVDRLVKNKNRRDYYKILGVKKTTSEREIKKAYNQLVLKWHPDKAKDENDRLAYEKKTQELNDAREVLLDKEKRKMFDSGIDPLNQEEMNEHNSQNHFRHGGGNPFHFQQGSFFNDFFHFEL